MRGVQQVFRNTKVELGKEVFRHGIVFYSGTDRSRRTDKGLQNHRFIKMEKTEARFMKRGDRKKKSEKEI